MPTIHPITLNLLRQIAILLFRLTVHLLAFKPGDSNNACHTKYQCLIKVSAIAYGIHPHIGGMILRSAGNDPYHVARTALRTIHIFPHITHNNAE
jgi:hypothetical protein